MTARRAAAQDVRLRAVTSACAGASELSSEQPPDHEGECPPRRSSPAVGSGCGCCFAKLSANCPRFPGGNQELPLDGSQGATVTGEGAPVPCPGLALRSLECPTRTQTEPWRLGSHLWSARGALIWLQKGGWEGRRQQDHEIIPGAKIQGLLLE